MRWVLALLGLVAVVALARVYRVIKRAREQNGDDWDARRVRELRTAGATAFTPYEVDFFFSLPDEAACTSLRRALEPEGFSTDARTMDDQSTGGYSLHARKHLRVSVTEMQDYSKRFRALAEQFGGQYDGWTTDPTRALSDQHLSQDPAGGKRRGDAPTPPGRNSITASRLPAAPKRQPFAGRTSGPR